MTPGRRQWRCSGLFIVNFENIPHIFSVSIFEFEWKFVCLESNVLIISTSINCASAFFRFKHH